MKKHVRVLMIDDNQRLAVLLREKLSEEQTNLGVAFHVDWRQELEDAEYDLYVVGTSKSTPVVKEIRKQDELAEIYVVSDHEDFALLRDLFRLKISGFIDRKNFDILPILETSRKITLRAKLKILAEKAKELNAVYGIKR